ncbi:hypothetical protein D8Y22_16100 [Salinadaptatus halalkaliphilus]|uniref:DUF8060 domain-containing protein n=1 Tax=Salinadaptatus halalkaliphilus TaxID=2419781 RepID=A0A4S3TIJ5_9EURY|nr:hypothetical protein [Salinadaptatus halalkaliphilus]THE63849.1 hypothetical protein D8Y22_16100 [Salinadaptatus halalkaliphilus]
MTDTTTRNSATEPTVDQPPVDGTEPPSESETRSQDVWRLLAWAGLAICSLVALVALVQFYASVTDAIDLWVEPRHQPLIHAAFNLVVLCGSLIGVSVLVRELS